MDGVSADVEEAKSRMAHAFSTVVENESVPSVGGLAVMLFGSERGFRYQPRMCGSGFEPVSGETGGGSLLRSVGVGGGSYRYSMLVPENPGVGAIGLHIVELNLGALFCPLLQEAPFVFENVSADRFVACAASDRKINLTGPRWAPRTS